MTIITADVYYFFADHSSCVSRTDLLDINEVIAFTLIRFVLITLVVPYVPLLWCLVRSYFKHSVLHHNVLHHSLLTP